LKRTAKAVFIAVFRLPTWFPAYYIISYGKRKCAGCKIQM